ncbi:YadA-like family protein [Paraburkholderia sediminicola]|nr:YadA-like family protein [Paraburkholderia sediminicola]
MGYAAKATKDNSVALGAGSTTTADLSQPGYKPRSTMLSGEASTANGEVSVGSLGKGRRVGAGSVADRANTVLVSAVGAERQITSVADGTQGTDAVNLNQLNAATTGSNACTDQRIAGVQGQISDVAKGAYSGIAAATALTTIPDVDKGKTLSFGAGVSTYKGYQAVAIGGTARITENIKVKAGAGMGSNGTTIGVGASYQR